MKFQLFLLALTLASTLATEYNGTDEEWVAFKEKFQKVYSTEEDRFRKGLWLESLKQINLHNSGNFSYTMGSNFFTDLTNDEAAAYRCGNSARASNESPYTGCGLLNITSGTAPLTFDWRKKGAVTPVKNQGTECGACYAFASVAALEGYCKIVTGALVRLSEQNIIDCSDKYNNTRCNGGKVSNSYSYIIANGGIASEAKYPYTGSDNQTCYYTADKRQCGIRSCKILDSVTESRLAKFIKNNGPITVSIRWHPNLNKYEGGVFKASDCNNPNLDTHALTIVGYGQTTTENYWILKNSWGPIWGVDGYLWLAKDQNNMCGVIDRNVYAEAMK